MSDIQYTLKRDITTFVYPSHIKRPEGFFGSNFFEKHIPLWNRHLSHLMGKPNIVGIEIGTLHGDMSIWAAHELVNGKDSIHYTIDINETEYLKNNLAPYIGKNVKFIKGKSYDVLRKYFEKEKIADYVYIDGSHLASDVMCDAVLAWSLLKNDGIMIFDDYFWGKHLEGKSNVEHFKPKLAIDAFLTAFTGHCTVLEGGWQVFIKKIKYEYPPEELEANYIN